MYISKGISDCEHVAPNVCSHPTLVRIFEQMCKANSSFLSLAFGLQAPDIWEPCPLFVPIIFSWPVLRESSSGSQIKCLALSTVVINV